MHPTAGFLFAIVAAAVVVEGTKWRAELGVGANGLTGTLSITSDDTTLYTADSRGTIFAVEALTGRVRWSIPGSAALDRIYIFPSIPELVYYTSWVDFPGQLTLRAIRRTDGAEMGLLRNLSTGDLLEETYSKVLPTKYGLVMLHLYGLLSTDAYLNVRWQVDNPNGFLSGQYFTHLAASDTLVATVARYQVAEVEGRGISFDAETGRVVCNISNITTAVLPSLGIPFIINEDGWSIMDHTLGSADAAYLLPRAVNFKRCSVYRTTYLNTVDLWAGGTVIPPTNYSDPSERTLYFGYTRASLNGSIWWAAGNWTPAQQEVLEDTYWGNWTITHSRIGSNATIWNLTLPAQPLNVWSALQLHPSSFFGQAPLISKAYGVPDAVILWYLGSFSAVDTATGAIRWSLAPTTVPTAAPQSWKDPQTVFPLGDGGRLFVPNLMGYTVVDTYTSDVLEVNLAQPIQAVNQFRDPQTNEMFIVYVDLNGALVCI